MALLSPRVPRLPLAAHSAGALRCCGRVAASAARCQVTASGSVAAGSSSSSELEAIRWGSAKLQGAREEMEDEVVLRPESLLHGFSFAAVLDGHAGFSTVQFLRHARTDHLFLELQCRTFHGHLTRIFFVLQGRAVQGMRGRVGRGRGA